MTYAKPPTGGAPADSDYTASCPEIARKLLGDPNPNLTTPDEWRYGSRGSLSIDLHRGIWHDHEQNTGGGMLDLICRERGGNRAEAAEWMKAEGLMAASAGPTRQQSRIVAAYDYTTEAGELLFQVCRMEPKDFRQRKPKTGGGWDWSTKGIRRVPYRLPELLAPNPDAVVFITEGEKDADRLADLGLVATTNPGGAGKWPDEFGRYFTGRRVAILADNDQAGQDHAVAVRDSLKRAGIDAAILNLPGLPAKGDVSDWLQAGGTAEALTEMAGDPGAAEAPGAKPKPAFEFVAVGDLQYRDPEFVIDGLMETDCLGLIFGDPGIGKTFVAVDMALSVASGTPYHGRPVRQGTVFYIAGEGHNGLARRFHAWSRHRGVPLASCRMFKSERAAQFLDAASAAAVAEAVEGLAAQFGAPALIVIDTLARNFGAGDENATKDMNEFIAAVDDLRARFPGSTILIVHHSGHADKQRARGAMSLKGALDFEFRVEAAEGVAMQLVNTKMKDASAPDSMAFNLETVHLGGKAESAVPVQTEAPERENRPSKAQLLALNTYVTAAVAGGVWKDGAFLGVDLEDWRAAFYAKHTGDTPEAKKKAFQRVRTDLQGAGRVTVENDLYFVRDHALQIAIMFERDKRDKAGHFEKCPGAEAGT